MRLPCLVAPSKPPFQWRCVGGDKAFPRCDLSSLIAVLEVRSIPLYIATLRVRVHTCIEGGSDH